MSTWQEGDVQTNGITLHYYRTGGDKPQLVLAHGVTDNGLCFTRVAQALEANYDLIMVDARGHGQSAKPESGYSPAEHAADLAGLIDGLGLDRPAVIAHSMGARSAAYLAAGWTDRVRGLVLEDPPWRSLTGQGDVDPAARALYHERILTRRAMTIDEVIAQGRQLNAKWADEDFPAWAAAKHQVVPQVVEGSGTAQRPWGEVIADIQCPTLLLIGEQGVEGSDVPAIVTPETAAAAHELNARVEFVQVPGAGHNIRRDQFDGYMTAVRPFLQQLFAS